MLQRQMTLLGSQHKLAGGDNAHVENRVEQSGAATVWEAAGSRSRTQARRDRRRRCQAKYVYQASTLLALRPRQEVAGLSPCGDTVYISGSDSAVLPVSDFGVPAEVLAKQCAAVCCIQAAWRRRACRRHLTYIYDTENIMRISTCRKWELLPSVGTWLRMKCKDQDRPMERQCQSARLGAYATSLPLAFLLDSQTAAEHGSGTGMRFQETRRNSSLLIG